MPQKTDIELKQKELLKEIGKLRVTFQDIIDRYQTNLESDMVWCINILSTPEQEEMPDGAKDIRQLELMKQVIDDLKLKPKKGRLKDIRRINESIELLLANLGE